MHTGVKEKEKKANKIVQDKTHTRPLRLMRAAVLEKPGDFRVREVTLKRPAAGQVRIRVEGCGVCASNLPNWEGKPWFSYPLEPGAPGHEGFGTVDEVGEKVAGLGKGDPVAFLSTHAFAQFDVVEVNSVVRLPEWLRGRAFPGEPLSCAMNIFERSDIRPGQTVAIIGIGFLGSLLTQLVSNTGARVIAVSRRKFALKTAERNGAHLCIPLDDHEKIVSRVFSETENKGCERVIEVVGKQWPLDLAGDIIAEYGRLIIGGYHQDGLRQVDMQQWNWRAIDVVNAHERAVERYTDGIRRAIAAVESGALKPDSLYTHEFGLEDVQKAFEFLSSRPDGFMKGLIRP